MKWSQNGFVSGKLEETPRNLMAFKDGTVNPRKMTSLKSMSSLTMVGLKMERIVLFDAFKSI